MLFLWEGYAKKSVFFFMGDLNLGDKGMIFLVGEVLSLILMILGVVKEDYIEIR